MKDNTYNILKRIAQVVLPALASLYFGLAQIWGLPYAGEVVGTISLIDTFLGVILGISTKSYNKMIANVSERDEDMSDGVGE